MPPHPDTLHSAQMKTSLNKSIESLMLGLALSTGTGHRWVGEEGGRG